MKKRRAPSAKRKPDLDETEADQMAADIRRQASKLTPEQRAEYVRRGMVKIYGGEWPKQATGTQFV